MATEQKSWELWDRCAEGLGLALSLPALPFVAFARGLRHVGSCGQLAALRREQGRGLAAIRQEANRTTAMFNAYLRQHAALERQFLQHPWPNREAALIGLRLYRLAEQRLLAEAAAAMGPGNEEEREWPLRRVA